MAILWWTGGGHTLYMLGFHWHYQRIESPRFGTRQDGRVSSLT